MSNILWGAFDHANRHTGNGMADVETKIDRARGERLRTALRDARMNGSDLARALGVTRAAVSHWLKTGLLTEKNLGAAADALKCSYEWLATGRGPRELKPKEIVMSEGELVNPSELGGELAKPVRPWLTADREIWRLTTDNLAAARMGPGDYVVIDLRQKDTARDIVLAMVDGVPVFRMILPPFLVALPFGPKPQDILVDNLKTVVRGVVVWSFQPPR